ncbi:hypothetical protein LA080_007498 [Diaporthe eres]|nr:hypothetical protein LA080_007498 [Diaporthe eres]
MDSATELPSSLVRQMNSAASITTLNTYRTGVGKDALGGALNIEAQYDRQSARFVSRLPSAGLQHIIENYKSLNGNNYFWANFDPDTCTWHQVHDELNKVEDEYQLKGKRNHIRRAFRVKKFAKTLFGDQVADVDRMLQSVTEAQHALNSQIGRLQERRDDLMASKVDRIEIGTNVIRKNQHEHQHQLITHVRQLDETSKTYASFIKDQNAIIERLHAENLALKLKASREHETLNLAHQIFDELLRNRDFNLMVMQQQTERYLPEAPTQAVVVQNLDELAMILCFEPEARSHVDDLYSTLRQYDSFSEKGLAQAAYLSETKPFRQWLQDLQSDHLLVDGHCENHSIGTTSPMSVFCASLIQSLLDRAEQHKNAQSPNIVLYFFCGQHRYDEGPLAGPQGLIRSLTTQLILAWPSQFPDPDLRFLSSLLHGRAYGVEEDLEVGVVCRIFHALSRQLPPSSTVHCIIDGIPYFETSIGGWTEDICEVVDCLRRCCSYNIHNAPRATVKVLLASAGRSTQVREICAPNRIVELRAGSLYSSVVSPRALISNLQSQASFSDLLTEDESIGEYVCAYKPQSG